jgi:hypothetical protein
LRQFDMRDFVIVLFQTNRVGNQKQNSSHFDHCNVRDTKFKNSRIEIFLLEFWNLNITKKFMERCI